jgi:hypothetical protein
MAKTNQPEARIFYADTRFERIARRRGGVDRESALKHAQTEVDCLMTDFRIWIEKEFEQIDTALAEFERNLTDTSALERACRGSEQLRDVGGTMGYELVTFIAKTLCEVLDAYIAGGTYDKDVIRCHQDAFKLARLEAYRHLRPDEVPEMTKGLLRMVEIASIVPK